MYTEFIINPAGTIFVAAKRDCEFLLSRRSNTPNVSNNLNNFRQLNVTGNCSYLTQIASENTGDMLYHRYHNQKRDTELTLQI